MAAGPPRTRSPPSKRPPSEILCMGISIGLLPPVCAGRQRLCPPSRGAASGGKREWEGGGSVSDGGETGRTSANNIALTSALDFAPFRYAESLTRRIELEPLCSLHSCRKCPSQGGGCSAHAPAAPLPSAPSPRFRTYESRLAFLPTVCAGRQRLCPPSRGVASSGRRNGRGVAL